MPLQQATNYDLCLCPCLIIDECNCCWRRGKCVGTSLLSAFSMAAIRWYVLLCHGPEASERHESSLVATLSSKGRHCASPRAVKGASSPGCEGTKGVRALDQLRHRDRIPLVSVCLRLTSCSKPTSHIAPVCALLGKNQKGLPLVEPSLRWLAQPGACTGRKKWLGLGGPQQDAVRNPLPTLDTFALKRRVRVRRAECMYAHAGAYNPCRGRRFGSDATTSPRYAALA